MMLSLRRRCTEERGQMAVELAVIMPVAISIAVIVVNAMTFFSECAAFDRVSRNVVRICAASPAYGQDLNQSITAVGTALEESISMQNEASSVTASTNGLGYTTFVLTLTYSPTLFGLGLRSEIFGVQLPVLRHSTSIVVDPYRPGMLL